MRATQSPNHAGDGSARRGRFYACDTIAELKKLNDDDRMLILGHIRRLTKK